MLIQFSVENYRCFRDRVTLSMVPASADKSHWAERVVSSAHGTKMNVLKAAAILGANASGKSTLIHAIRFMKDFVAGSSRERLKDSPTGVTPFRLDAQHAAKPSKFEAVFLQDSIRWVYGFAVDSQRVVEEHLSNYPVRGERVLFTRKLDGKGKTAEFYFGPSWGGPAKALRELTRENALLLSVGAQMKSGDKFIPEVLLSARTMQACLDLIKPLLGEGGGSLGIGNVGCLQGADQLDRPAP